MTSKANLPVIAMAKLTTDKLEDWELAAFHMAAITGADLSKKTFYEKVKPLLADGVKLHRETLSALDVIVKQRMNGGNS